MTSFNVVANSDRINVAFLHDGELRVADSESHGNIRDILSAVLDGDTDEAVRLLDPTKVSVRSFERLSGRVTVNEEGVFLDGDPAPAALGDAIVKMRNENQDFGALVNFLERLANNPNQHSVEHLYRWLDSANKDANTKGFTITPDGFLVSYKGVQSDGNGGYQSSSSGKAIVDGVERIGHIPNYVGAVVEMPRSEVEFDPRRGCSTGLHAGTWSYAQSYASGAMLRVLIDPRDVVSVPTDASDQKMRVCRYTVDEIIDVPETRSVLNGNESPDWDADEEFWGEREYDDGDDDRGDFSVGDRVEIIDDFSGDYDLTGEFATVVGLDSGIDGYPLEIRLDSGGVSAANAYELRYV
jgi:hypothetical protein